MRAGRLGHGPSTSRLPACQRDRKSILIRLSLIPVAHDELLALIYLAITASELTSRMFMPLPFVNMYFKYALIGYAQLLFIKMFLSLSI